MNSEQGERIAALEATLKIAVAAILKEIKENREDMIRSMDKHIAADEKVATQMLKMHEEHYNSSTEHLRELIKLSGEVKAGNVAISEYVAGRWKWIVVLVPAILTIAMIAIAALKAARL